MNYTKYNSFYLYIGEYFFICIFYKMGDYKVQSVIFPKEKYTIKQAKSWLKENGFKSPKVDATDNFFRFRQIDPDYIENLGYKKYITKKMGDSGIEMIIAYKGKKKGGSLFSDKFKNALKDRAIDTAQKYEASSQGVKDDLSKMGNYLIGGEMGVGVFKGGIRKLKVINKTGGALRVKQIKRFLEESYKPTASNVDDYELDKDLSNDITKVHYNKSKNHAVVTHRGSDDLQDWYENAKYAVGSTTGKHFQQAEDTQRKAEAKYGADRISVVAHSKGAIHAEKFGKNAREIITLNKPVNAQDLLTSVPDKQYDIKTSGDPVSSLRGLQRGKKALVIKSKTFSNPLTEHSINVLDRLPENQVIGDQSIGGSRPEFAKDGSKIIYCGGAISDAFTTGQRLKCFYKVGELKTKLREWLNADGKPKKEITAFLKGKKKQEVINDLLKMTDVRQHVPQDIPKTLKCKYKVGELKAELRQKLTNEGKTKKEITAYLKGKKKADLIQEATPIVESQNKLKEIGKSKETISKFIAEHQPSKEIRQIVKHYKQTQKDLLEEALNPYSYHEEKSWGLQNRLVDIKKVGLLLFQKTGHKYGEFLPYCRENILFDGRIPTYMNQILTFIHYSNKRVLTEEDQQQKIKAYIKQLEEKISGMKNPKKTKEELEKQKAHLKERQDLQIIEKEKAYLKELVDAFLNGRWCVALDEQALADARYRRGAQERMEKYAEEQRRIAEEERKRQEAEMKRIEEQNRSLKLDEIKKRLDKIKVAEFLKKSIKQKAEEKRAKEEAKRIAEENKMGEQDFNVPDPTPAPVAEVKQSVNKIEEKIRELEKWGSRNGAVSYDPTTLITDIAFVNLMMKYGGRCIVNNIYKKAGIDLGIDINNVRGGTEILQYGSFTLDNLGMKLQECISRGIGVICIPLSLHFGTSLSGHANMLIYRPFKRLCERFEPHGVAYGNSMKDNKIFNDQLRELWEQKLTKYIGEVRFRDPEEVCPNPKGFQALEAELKGLAKEGGGFCSMWSFFLAEMTFLNPDKSTTAIIEEVFEITEKDPSFLKSVIRGYVLEVEKGLDDLFKSLGKGSFNFRKGESGKRVKGDEVAFYNWIISNVFDSQKYSEAPPNYEPLPDKLGSIRTKSDTEKLAETYENKLNSLSISQLGAINGLFGLKAWKGKKEDIIKEIVDAFINNKWTKYGMVSGIKDLEYILDKQLYKDPTKKRIGSTGFFLKVRDGTA